MRFAAAENWFKPPMFIIDRTKAVIQQFLEKSFKYSELDSSGSVKKLTYGVSLKQKSGETELYILFNKLFLFTLIEFMKYFNL